MTLPTTLNAPQEIAVYSYKTVTRALHEVSRWIETVPDFREITESSAYFLLYDDDKKFWYYDLERTANIRISQIKNIIATDGYKQAIAKLAPLAGLSPASLIANQIMLLIGSKPFGHTAPPEYTAVAIADIGDMDSPPSIGAVLLAFREMRSTLSDNVPSTGSIVKCLAAAQERFSREYNGLLELEDYARRLASDEYKNSLRRRFGLSPYSLPPPSLVPEHIEAEEEDGLEDLACASLVAEGDTDGDLPD